MANANQSITTDDIKHSYDIMPPNPKITHIQPENHRPMHVLNDQASDQYIDTNLQESREQYCLEPMMSIQQNHDEPKE